MIQVFRRLSLLTLVLFILGIFISGYSLFTLPTALVNSPVLDDADLQFVSPVLTDLNIKILLTLFTGVASVIFAVLLEKKSNRENIVYIQSGKETKSEIIRKNIGIEEEEDKKEIDISDFEPIIEQGLDETDKISKLLSKLCMNISASQGAFYKPVTDNGIRKIQLTAAFAFSIPESETISFEFGEGLAGQVAKEEKKVVIDEVPEGYIKVFSGLGESSPRHIFIVPIKVGGGELFGVVEISSFSQIKEYEQDMVESVFERLVNTKEKSEEMPKKTENSSKKGNNRKKKE